MQEQSGPRIAIRRHGVESPCMLVMGKFEEKKRMPSRDRSLKEVFFALRSSTALLISPRFKVLGFYKGLQRWLLDLRHRGA